MSENFRFVRDCHSGSTGLCSINLDGSEKKELYHHKGSSIYAFSLLGNELYFVSKTDSQNFFPQFLSDELKGDKYKTLVEELFEYLSPITYKNKVYLGMSIGLLYEAENGNIRELVKQEEIDTSKELISFCVDDNGINLLMERNGEYELQRISK